MKSFRILFIGSFLALISLSCQKEIVYDENPFLIKKRPLDFKELSSNKPAVTIHQEALLLAKASGDELGFSWQSQEGTLVTSDSIATFFHSETGFFSIQCTVTDKYGNSQTKEIFILVSQELVFSLLEITDTEIPIGFTTELSAIASGHELNFQWETSGGTLLFNNDKATFSTNQAGTYQITCTVKDKTGAMKSHTTEIKVVKGLVFKSLIATPNFIKPFEYSEITAVVLGNDVAYRWKCEPPGNLFGSGMKIQFAICHQDVFEIFCEARDKDGNTETKSVIITVN